MDSDKNTIWNWAWEFLTNQTLKCRVQKEREKKNIRHFTLKKG